LIVKRQYRHPFQLWKRIMNDVAIASFRKQRTAADRENDQSESTK
jgi:hypothetical protein